MRRRSARSQFPLLANEPAGVLWSGIARTVLFVSQQRRPVQCAPWLEEGEIEALGAQGTSPALHTEILSPGRRKQNPAIMGHSEPGAAPSQQQEKQPKRIPKSADSKSLTGLSVTGVPLWRSDGKPRPAEWGGGSST